MISPTPQKHSLETMEDLMRETLGEDRYRDLLFRHRRLVAHLQKQRDKSSSHSQS